jgi:hypothetical protein
LSGETAAVKSYHEIFSKHSWGCDAFLILIQGATRWVFSISTINWL